jgi:hypothetical protein
MFTPEKIRNYRPPQLCALVLTWFLQSGASQKCAAAEPLRIEGDLKITAFLSDALGGNQTFIRNFTIEVERCRWLIQTQDPSGKGDEDSYQVGTDGDDAYLLIKYSSNYTAKAVDFKDYTDPQHLVMRKKAHGTRAEGRVFPGSTPPPGETFTAPLWLAYCSSCVLATNTTGKLRQVWSFEDREMQQRRFTLPASWQVFSDALHLPSFVTYMSDGKRYLRKNNKSITIEADSPYNHGFTNAIYTVTEKTNFNGMIIPTRFTITRFKPQAKGTNASQIQVASQFEGVTRIIQTGMTRPNYLPTLEFDIGVVDYRYFETIGQTVSYGTKGMQWLSEGAVKGTGAYGMRKAAKAAGVTDKIHHARAFNPRPFYLLWLVLSVVIPVYFWFRSQSKKQKT